MMKIALFAGSFDPPTLGHLEIIERASKLCRKLYIAVIESSNKRHFPTAAQERVALLTVLIEQIKNAEIISFSGLVVDCAKEHKAEVLVRGLRNIADFDYEMQMASANNQLMGIETVCLFSSPQYSQINSTLIREIARQGGSLEGFVPIAIKKRVEKLFRKAK